MSAEKGYAAFGKTVFVILLLVVSTVVNGLVLSRLWAWFVADTFGLQELSIAEAVGLSLVARFALTTWDTSKSEQKTFGTLMTEALVLLVMANGSVLLAGLVVVQFT